MGTPTDFDSANIISKLANMLSKPTIPKSTKCTLFTCYFRFLQFLANLKCLKTFQQKKEKKKVLPTDRPYFFRQGSPKHNCIFFGLKETNLVKLTRNRFQDSIIIPASFLGGKAKKWKY